MATRAEYATVPTLLLWQMHSLFRDEPLVRSRLRTIPGGSTFAMSDDEYTNLVRHRDRARLDEPIPDHICRQLVAYSKKKYVFRSLDVVESETGDLTLLNVYDAYGGGLAELIAHKGYATLEQVAAAQERRTAFLAGVSKEHGRGI